MYLRLPDTLFDIISLLENELKNEISGNLSCKQVSFNFNHSKKRHKI